MKALLVSFSGGETSAYMSYLLAKNHRQDRALYFVYANTGQEREETLEFVDRCDKEWGLGVTWVEAAVNPVQGRGTRHKIVEYKTASRDGQPFEDVMRKYGISNQAYPHCTRELKMRPIHSFMRSLGLKKGYETAIGIRADEYRRCGTDPKIVYPLASNWIVSKSDVKDFWRRQSFGLGLRDYQGNCKWCWKKSYRKLFSLIGEDPSIFDFPRRMEKKYGKVKCPNGSRVFFRGNNSTDDLFQLKEQQESIQTTLLDMHSGCSESCEMFPTV